MSQANNVERYKAIYNRIDDIDVERTKLADERRELLDEVVQLMGVKTSDVIEDRLGKGWVLRMRAEFNVGWELPYKVTPVINCTVAPALKSGGFSSRSTRLSPVFDPVARFTLDENGRAV